MKALAAALAATLALGACGSMAPPYQRPAAPVPAQFPHASASSGNGSGSAASQRPWQDFFAADARLKRLIETALANNRDLRVAVLNIEQARATLRARDADLWPTVNAGIATTRTPTASGGVSNLSTAGVQITAWEADFFGRIRSLDDVAAAQLLASAEGLKAVQIALIGNVASAHIALQADDELLAVTKQTLATREESLRLTQLRFDNGASSGLDLRAAESLLAGARVSLAQLTRQRALDQNALVLLLGQGLPADLPPAVVLSQAPALPDLPAGLPSEVLVQRPDVRQAEQQLIAANANIGAARAAFFPKISLTGSLGSVSGPLSKLFQAGTFGWTVAPQWLLPIFDAGRNQANWQLSQAARDIALAQYEKAVQAAFREVADALAGRATLQDQLRAQTAQALAEQGRVDLTQLRYRNGASSSLDVLDAQRSLFTAQLARVQALALLQQNAAVLYRVLGGGWSDVPR